MDALSLIAASACIEWQGSEARVEFQCCCGEDESFETRGNHIACLSCGSEYELKGRYEVIGLEPVLSKSQNKEMAEVA